jgi:hypothetical protein
VAEIVQRGKRSITAVIAGQIADQEKGIGGISYRAQARRRWLELARPGRLAVIALWLGPSAGFARKLCVNEPLSGLA